MLKGGFFRKAETLNFTTKWLQLIMGSSLAVILAEKKYHLLVLGLLHSEGVGRLPSKGVVSMVATSLAIFV